MASWAELNQQAGGSIKPKVKTWAELNLAAKPSRFDILNSQAQVAQANAKYSESVLGTIKNTFLEAGNIFKGAGQEALKTSEATFQNLFAKGPELGEAIQQGVPQTIAKLGESALATVGVASLPLSIASAAASKIPALKQANDIINTGLGAIGTPGKLFGHAFVAALPISEESKKYLYPVAEELGSLGTQVYFGAKIMEAISKGEQPVKIQKIYDETPDEYKIPITAWERILIKNKTPEEIQINVQTPYIPETELPTIQIGRTPKSELPIIQVGVKPPRPPGITYEPIKPEVPITEPYKVPTLRTKPAITETSKPAPVIKPVAPSAAALEVATPKIKEGPVVSQFSKGIEADAVEAGLAKDFGQLPGHEKVNMKEQAKLVTDLYNSEPQRAINMIKGNETIPSDIHFGMLARGVAEIARMRGDVNTMREIAMDPHAVGVANYLGTELKMFDIGARDVANPVDIMREVKKTRETKVSGGFEKAVKETESVIKTEKARAVSTRPTWEEFIKKLACGIE